MAKLPTEREMERHPAPQPFLSLRHAVDRLFDDWFTGVDLEPLGLWKGQENMFSPQVDLSETEKEFQITAELPGLEQKDIQLTVTEDAVLLKGEKKAEKEEKGKNFYRRERTFGSFYRDIPLSGAIQKDKVRATFKNGILKINLPKAQQAKSAAKTISIAAE